jgi:tetratricopeptide (TPR) repeat protein
MNDLPRPWNYVLLIAISYAVLAVAEWHLARKAGPNERRISWPQRLALYGVVALVSILVMEAPQWTMWGGIAFLVVLLPLIGVLLALVYYYIWSANRILVEANRLANEGQIAAAIALLERNVDRQISRDRSFGAILLSNLARFYGQQKAWQAADAAVERAIELLPKDPVLIETKAALLRDRGQTQEARRLIESVLPLYSQSAPLLTTYAEILIDQGEWDWAQRMTEQIDTLLDSKEFIGVQNPAEWRTVRLAPLQQAIQRRESVFPAL